MNLDITPERIVDRLVERLEQLRFGPPISHVYNPLIYAREPFLRYWRTYGDSPREIVLLGMNPGPWGMAQTGVPFGDVGMVKGWLGIDGRVGQPDHVHPKRPILGYQCPRGEVSGQRLWGWARSRFATAQLFFHRFWVVNYCPLVFMEANGRNRTPDKLPESEKKKLEKICDEGLRRTIELVHPRWVIGVGVFAARRAAAALDGMDLRIGRITHPSPANPKASRDWDRLIDRELADLGIEVTGER
jgi:single-strand selective monofunctional uracil DNA glycosylase